MKASPADLPALGRRSRAGPAVCQWPYRSAGPAATSGRRLFWAIYAGSMLATLYTVGIAAEWPFVSQPDYTGPLVSALGGADISWLAGWFAAATAYLLLAARTPSPAEPPPPVGRCG